MDRLMRFWLLGLLLALGVGCKSRHSASAGDALSALRMEYAGRIRIDSSEHYILVRVQNPWDTARILHTYVLVGRETELPEGLPEGTLVRTPVEKHWYILRYIAGFCPNWGQSIGLVEYVICNISKYLKYKIVVLPGEWSTPEIL